MSISPARKAAFDILLRIERERAFSSVLLPQFEGRLQPADRGLCHELVLGTLRTQMRLDRILGVLRPGRKLDAEVRIAFRVGLYQLLFLDKIPARAAINESVELVKRARKTSATGLVNAILRRAASEAVPLVYKNDVERISVETSHPEWLIERWAERLGVVEAEHLARSNNQRPPIAFRTLAGGSDVAELIASARPSEQVSGCYLIDGVTSLLRRLADDGKIYLQDEASQMVALAVDAPSAGCFLDVCAAPGGKTGLIANRLRPTMAVAGDLYHQRAELLRGNTRRQGADVNVIRYDAETALPFAGEIFDIVLVDTPCSGTGTLRHNPEIRYFLQPTDIEELSLKQRRILSEASKAVKKGGLVVYSTCSLEPEEGESVAEWFLHDMTGFEQLSPHVASRFYTNDGFARTSPQKDGMDGFFIAAFRRL